jgi:predicted RNA-binding protein YlxR (DUF448 family)
LRRCIATGVIGDRDAMIRFVIADSGEPVPDLEASLPGRGYWVSADRAALDRAVARNAFARAARRPVAVPRDLPQQVALLSRRRCLALLGLARRAGQGVAGFEKVRTALQSRQVAVLIAASDGADDGRARLRALSGGLVPVVASFDAAALAQALGREHAVHAALAPGGIAQKFMAECRRYTAIAPAGAGHPETICGPARPAGHQS